MKYSSRFDTIQLSFSKRLKNLREERGVSRQQLENATGIPIASIGHYERGDRIPDMRVLWLMADFFEVTTDYLLGLNDDQQRIERWPGAVPVMISSEVDRMKSAITNMIGASLLSPYRYDAFPAYTEIVELVAKLDTIVSSHAHSLALKYPGFDSFGRFDAVTINGTSFREALVRRDHKALEYADDYDKALAEVQREVEEIAQQISTLVNVNILGAITCGAITTVMLGSISGSSNGPVFVNENGEEKKNAPAGMTEAVDDKRGEGDGNSR
ncbi:MAG: helix-turn-helix transcriptional regulator [Oscillospiraceae bacterium]